MVCYCRVNTGDGRMSKVRVAIIGVGHCASTLLQGVHYYSLVITKAPGATTTIVSDLQETGTDVVVNYLPVGA